MDTTASCLLSKDYTLTTMTTGVNCHNETLHFVNGVATIHLYPAFCDVPPQTFVIGYASNSVFARRPITVSIPGSMIENDAKRKYNIAYILDGTPEETKRTGRHLASAQISTHATDVVLVGIPAVERMDEFIPFENVFTAEEWMGQCGGPICYNNHTGKGAHLGEFIRRTIEPMVVNALHNKMSGVNRRLLGGYSLGGLMTFYILMKQPELFDLYLPLSPSLMHGFDETLSRWLPFPDLPNQYPDIRVFFGNSVPGDSMIVINNLMIETAIMTGSLVPGVNFYHEDMIPAEHSTSTVLAFLTPALTKVFQMADYI
jgi:predicted alpha/beta superfamily hydrolase